QSFTPDRVETRTGLSVRAEGRVAERVGASGAKYVPGRLIVKFKEGTSTASRLSALSAVSRTASMSTRPSYANFDMIRIGLDEDAESVARAFAARNDVEYAQPTYRIRPHFKPNDQFYPEQWNLPLIDM